MAIELLGTTEKDAELYVRGILFNQEGIGADVKVIREMGLMKKINPLLEPFVGVFPLEMKSLPTWWGDFKHKFAIGVIGEIKADISEQVNAELESGKVELKETQLILDAHAQFKTMTVDHFKDGTFPNGRKILKYLVSIAEQVRGKDNYEKSEWFQFFNKSNVAGGQLHIVSTPSVASHMCISNIFDKSGMSSCQGFTGYCSDGAIPSAVFGNVLTEDSLLIYVTGGRMEKIQKTEVSHQTMIARTFLRLFESNDARCKVCGNNKYSSSPSECCLDQNNIVAGKKLYIAFDRFYTQDTYFRDVFLTIKEIADKNGIEMCIFDGYNRQKDGGTQNWKAELASGTVKGVTPMGIKVMAVKKKNCEFCNSKSGCERMQRCKYYEWCKKRSNGEPNCMSCFARQGKACTGHYEYYADNSFNQCFSYSNKDHVHISSTLKLVKSLT